MDQTQVNPAHRAVLAHSLSQLRRAMVRDGLLGAIATLGDADLSLTQLGALLLLDDLGEQTLKALAGQLRRSLSATSRLVDQLVRRGLVVRWEDDQDRRTKRVAISDGGRTFLAEVARRRAEAQLAVMSTLSAEEQAEVIRAMQLLAEAARRRRDAHPGSPAGTA